ncbi:flagellar basal body-associated FliL family protein [Desulfovibrio legallii]|uniref:Flagellar protein FliL n=1 Tax=Desulfovibrio legallii TaxID=571438 RepID=A0A1G7NZP5_9BACT|nr:flagellar basal body-associated FliL family protein [Desulfovibrio legallii]SDF78660.1 flagellar FliL protein [Desulfovibrio legallii]
MAEKTALKTDPDTDALRMDLGPDPARRKVELDLDDAPFLKSEAATPAVAEGAPTPAVPEEGKPVAKKRLWRLVAAVGLLVFVGAGSAVWWFLLRTPPPPPPPAVKPEVVVVPQAPAAQPPQEQVKELAPFVVPRAVGGDAAFLICKFSVVYKNPVLGAEMDRKMVSLRDALYFYLGSKTDVFLLDAGNAAVIKHDLTEVLNDYLTQGQVTDILLESYLNS